MLWFLEYVSFSLPASSFSSDTTYSPCCFSFLELSFFHGYHINLNRHVNRKGWGQQDTSCKTDTMMPNKAVRKEYIKALKLTLEEINSERNEWKEKPTTDIRIIHSHSDRRTSWNWDKVNSGKDCRCMNHTHPLDDNCHETKIFLFEFIYGLKHASQTHGRNSVGERML